MKKALISVIVLLAAGSVFSADLNSSFKVGFQACSDSSFGIVLKAGHFESGLKAQLELYDPGDELLVAGAYLAWLFNSKDGMSSLGIGADFRNGFGSGIAEHVDLFLNTLGNSKSCSQWKEFRSNFRLFCWFLHNS